MIEIRLIDGLPRRCEWRLQRHCNWCGAVGFWKRRSVWPGRVGISRHSEWRRLHRNFRSRRYHAWRGAWRSHLCRQFRRDGRRSTGYGNRRCWGWGRRGGGLWWSLCRGLTGILCDQALQLLIGRFGTEAERSAAHLRASAAIAAARHPLRIESFVNIRERADSLIQVLIPTRLPSLRQSGGRLIF